MEGAPSCMGLSPLSQGLVADVLNGLFEKEKENETEERLTNEA